MVLSELAKCYRLRWKFSFFILLIWGVNLNTNEVNAQNKGFTITITDNAAIYNNRIDYVFTQDSLSVSGVGDFGRTPVNFLRRKLTKSESKVINKFLKSFPIDSLDDLYNNPFNPIDFENKGFYPRIMEVEIKYKSKSHLYKSINCWVRHSANLVQTLNPMLPTEVKIKYDKSAFNTIY